MARGDESARASASMARRNGPGQQLDPATEQAIVRVAERFLADKVRGFDRVRTDVQALTGDRGDNPAVRKGAFKLGLQRIPHAAGAPTNAEFNALVDAYNSLLVKLADLAR